MIGADVWVALAAMMVGDVSRAHDEIGTEVELKSRRIMNSNLVLSLQCQAAFSLI